ncbi:hypothetical protein EBBID32_18190 [Sphingobium indicum BiD32]|uniref:Uncharacterized protein n=1 Tax=Sphingobium indicum BiD32 TaxID=1301087 RepID=N1ML52_9SPHN|nr:hypothetical protein EBBID32_18190 [Sphingobium indicum BiD32]
MPTYVTPDLIRGLAFFARRKAGCRVKPGMTKGGMAMNDQCR